MNDAFTIRWKPTGPEDASAIAARLYGITGPASRMSSERDDTFRIDAGGARYTLKIANPAEDPRALDFQDGALLHLEMRCPEVPVPRLVRTLDGAVQGRLADEGSPPRIVRMLTFLDGALLHAVPASIGQSGAIGAALGALDCGLADYSGTPPAGSLLWDMSHAADLRRLVTHVGPDLRSDVAAIFDEFADRVLPATDSLPRQIIHNDFNPHNIVVDPADPARVTGIIDFGDMVFAPRIFDVAVAASYHLRHPDWRDHLAALMGAYGAKNRLTAPELDLLPLLLKTRMAMTITISEWRAADRPAEAAYIRRNHPLAVAGLKHLSSIADRDLTGFISGLMEGLPQ